MEVQRTTVQLCRKLDLQAYSNTPEAGPQDYNVQQVFWSPILGPPGAGMDTPGLD